MQISITSLQMVLDSYLENKVRCLEQEKKKDIYFEEKKRRERNVNIKHEHHLNYYFNMNCTN